MMALYSKLAVCSSLAAYLLTFSTWSVQCGLVCTQLWVIYFISVASFKECKCGHDNSMRCFAR